MRISLLLAALALAAPGCKRAPATDGAPRPCASNDDCPAGDACLDGRCASTAHGAAFLHPGNAITPQKVKAAMERLNAASEKRTDDKAAVEERERGGPVE